ncbi:MAG: type II toxin-antitoxin system HicB family antitoxin [Synergistaceae bacterium]|nr:type II toxin-antitoxin system HicB family antitoxin [Synergistaceae bacterium]
MRKYNLSLVYYPQDNGGFHVVCLESSNCFSCGQTIEEAEANIRDLIEEFLPQKAHRGGEIDEELFRQGLCMKGKLFREIEVEA